MPKKLLSALVLTLGLVAVTPALTSCTPAQWRAAQNWNDTTPKPDPFNRCTWRWVIRYWVSSGYGTFPVWGWVCMPDRGGPGFN